MDPLARYHAADLDWLRAPHDAEVEGPFVERKERCQPDDLAAAISAFGNGQEPGGLIVIGVSKDGRFVGTKGAAGDELVRHARDLIGGRWAHRFVAADGVTLLYVWAPFSPERVARLSNGRAFQRVGKTTRELSPDQILELRYDRGELHVEDEPAAPLTDDIIDPELREPFLTAMKARNGLTVELSFDRALRNKSLVVDRGGRAHLTNAGLLVLGARPTDLLGGAQAHFQRFDGTEERVGSERNVVKDQWFDGPIPKLVPRLRDFVRGQLRDLDHLGEDGRFIQEPEYPELAWEEAIVNALTHRSYSVATAAVQVRMFDDRLEVESPGRFPAPFRRPVRVADLYSAPRNPHLAHALAYFGLVRLAQEGTKRMDQEMRKMGLPPPELEEVRGGSWVRVTLRNDIERRRRRPSDDASGWAEVATMLHDPVYFYRKRAIDRWSTLWDGGRGLRAPAEVIDRALAMLFRLEVTSEEIDAMWPLVEPAIAPAQSEKLAEAFIRGSLSHRTGDLLHRVARALVRSEQAIEIVTLWLESTAPRGGADIDAAFAMLIVRSRSQPVPERAWIERVLALTTKYGAVSSWAAEFHKDITGLPFPGPPDSS